MADVNVNKATGTLIIYWLIVGIPLAWGVYNTLKRALLLFNITI
jgi:hypothetical protein